MSAQSNARQQQQQQHQSLSSSSNAITSAVLAVVDDSKSIRQFIPPPHLRLQPVATADATTTTTTCIQDLDLLTYFCAHSTAVNYRDGKFSIQAQPAIGARLEAKQRAHPEYNVNHKFQEFIAQCTTPTEHPVLTCRSPGATLGRLHLNVAYDPPGDGSCLFGAVVRACYGEDATSSFNRLVAHVRMLKREIARAFLRRLNAKNDNDGDTHTLALSLDDQLSLIRQFDKTSYYDASFDLVALPPPPPNNDATSLHLMPSSSCDNSNRFASDSADTTAGQTAFPSAFSSSARPLSSLSTSLLDPAPATPVDVVEATLHRIRSLAQTAALPSTNAKTLPPTTNVNTNANPSEHPTAAPVGDASVVRDTSDDEKRVAIQRFVAFLSDTTNEEKGGAGSYFAQHVFGDEMDAQFLADLLRVNIVIVNMDPQQPMPRIHRRSAFVRNSLQGDVHILHMILPCRDDNGGALTTATGDRNPIDTRLDLMCGSNHRTKAGKEGGGANADMLRTRHTIILGRIGMHYTLLRPLHLPLIEAVLTAHYTWLNIHIFDAELERLDIRRRDLMRALHSMGVSEPFDADILALTVVAPPPSTNSEETTTPRNSLDWLTNLAAVDAWRAQVEQALPVFRFMLLDIVWPQVTAQAAYARRALRASRPANVLHPALAPFSNYI